MTKMTPQPKLGPLAKIAGFLIALVVVFCVAWQIGSLTSGPPHGSSTSPTVGSGHGHIHSGR
ncbi:hypothetical protein OG563_38050 [Nocardia vinacea]|uniref:Uncharacterized protein n=1 Tax=Nocardia vinacea TaxID=96468 RepID=A0ABZ1YSK5_9NOCA|nr:hypothetical protein [Nocardia vinacea]